MRLLCWLLGHRLVQWVPPHPERRCTRCLAWEDPDAPKRLIERGAVPEATPRWLDRYDGTIPEA